MNFIPELPIGDWISAGVQWLQDNLLGFFTFVSTVLGAIYDGLAAVLEAPSTIIIILIAGVIAFLVRGWKFALFTVLAFAFVESIDLWEPAMQTLSQVLIATAVAALIAIPIGILAARSHAVSMVVRPVLDFMQTLPPFVYLVPAVALFSIGVVPGLVSTVIFATPPGVRLTELGLRQVDREMVEAGEAFGAPPRQILARIQIPLALPTIMAGINQVIMLSLSMVVLAGIVGAPGLGQEIFSAVQQIAVGPGFEAGFGVVVIAIFLDRVTGAFGKQRRNST